MWTLNSILYQPIWKLEYKRTLSIGQFNMSLKLIFIRRVSVAVESLLNPSWQTK